VTITQDNEQFICQESLPFTLKNNSTLIQLTKAPGVRVTYEEKGANVHSTDPHVVKILKHEYVKEEWNGRLTVFNSKDESVIVVIEIRLLGEVSNYSVPPKTNTVQHGQDVVNKQHDIKWNIRLESQQRQEINYCRFFNQLDK
jgi:hypothetical protein